MTVPAAGGLLPADLLRGSTVLVTGGGSGVNLGIAAVLAGLGANLTLCGRTRETLDRAAVGLREAGAEVLTCVADVRDPGQVDEAFAQSAAAFGPVSGVVSGAAGNFLAPAEELSPNGFGTVVAIDLLGSFHCARSAYEQLRATRGSLLFVSGGQSRTPYAHQAHAGAAKAGVDQLMRSLALEWGRHGIRVNSIMPGPVAGTEGMSRLGEAGLGPWIDSVPLGRLAGADEIGRMAAVLLSPIASFVTGALVHVDGGLDLSGGALISRALLHPKT